MPSSNLLLASKVVIVEEPPSIRNIPGVATAIAAFAGITERGPVRVPQFITSFDEYVDTFGGYVTGSNLPHAILGAFQNGATAIWVSRVTHYTDINDGNTSTAVAGAQNLPDRGGAAVAAILDSNEGPFQLEPGQQLDVNIDGAGTDSLVFAATPAEITSGNSEPFALVNGDTFVYQTNESPESATLGPQRTIEFLTADFSSIGAATAQEIVNVINRDGIGIAAEVSGTDVLIRSDARGAQASINVLASSTSISAGKLNIASGTVTSSGPNNVNLIDAVTATEIAALLTALPLSAGTATTFTSTTTDDSLRLTGVTTGVGGTVVIEATTTALGIFSGALPITQTGSAAGVTDTLTITALDPGEFIEGYEVVIEAATNGDSDRFNLRVTKGGVTQESWPNLSLDDTDDRYVEDFINANSGLIVVTDLFSAAVSPNNLPALGTYSSWAGQDDGLTGLVDADFTGSEAGQTGFYAFDLVDNMSLLCCPDRPTAAVHNAMVQYVEVHRTGSAFAILDPPAGLDEQGIRTYLRSTASLANASEFAALYWPRIEILNPSTAVFGNATRLVVPPSGHVMGDYARTDASRPGGVYENPAGVQVGRLFGVLGFETDDTLDERKRDVVYPERINPITTIDGSPRHIDGSRTLKGDGNFPSVAERRGVIFIEQSIKRGLLFAKHRNNDRRLRMSVKRTIEAFLLTQFNNGAFRGETPAESFYVDVSDALNPIEEVFAGRLNVRIGLATQKPAEFIIVRVTQDTRELETRLADQLG